LNRHVSIQQFDEEMKTQLPEAAVLRILPGFSI
jgi:hypothetical protein